MLLSEILGKRVISLMDAKELGVVSGAYVHKSTYEIKYVCINENLCISIKDLYAIDEVITTAKDLCSLVEENYFKILSTHEVITVSGKRLGIIKDLNLDAKKTKRELVCDKGNVKLRSIVSVSNNIIVVNPTYRVLNKEIKEPVSKVLEIKGKVETIPTEQNLSAPKYDFLIGKKVTSEVSDISRSFVLMAGTLITERVIQNAKKAGKLSELVNKSI